ncbi:MAG: hypothetical protein HY851_11325 [candidate division Zixibacteria bacterium]|nr:hypothetical protein [candidate division Zixibacteria bacterium]
MKKIVLLMTTALLLLIIGCSGEKTTAPAVADSSPDLVTKDLQVVLDQNRPEEFTNPQASPDFHMGVVWFETRFDVFVATFIWGHFAKATDSTATPTDWSGKLNFGAVGGLKVRSAICFEKGQDSLLPSPDSSTIAWASTTFRDFDGFNVVILAKRGIVYLVEPRLAFSTAPFSLEIPLSGLVRYNALYKVDDHNGVAIFARQVPRPQCPHGGILGVWHRDSTAQNGPFEGYWLPAGMMPMPPLPVNMPKVYGKFFTTEENKQLFVGKYTDTTGAEVGELFGTWVYDDPTMCMMCGAGHALFKGRFTINGQGEVGDVMGEIGIPPGGFTTPKMNMPIRGAWRMDCSGDRPNDEARAIN